MAGLTVEPVQVGAAQRDRASDRQRRRARLRWSLCGRRTVRLLRGRRAVAPRTTTKGAIAVCKTQAVQPTGACDRSDHRFLRLRLGRALRIRGAAAHTGSPVPTINPAMSTNHGLRMGRPLSSCHVRSRIASSGPVVRWSKASALPSHAEGHLTALEPPDATKESDGGECAQSFSTLLARALSGATIRPLNSTVIHSKRGNNWQYTKWVTSQISQRFARDGTWMSPASRILNLTR